jgi:hypothetical protein
MNKRKDHFNKNSDAKNLNIFTEGDVSVGLRYFSWSIVIYSCQEVRKGVRNVLSKQQNVFNMV